MYKTSICCINEITCLAQIISALLNEIISKSRAPLKPVAGSPMSVNPLKPWHPIFDCPQVVRVGVGTFLGEWIPMYWSVQRNVKGILVHVGILIMGSHKMRHKNGSFIFAYCIIMKQDHNAGTWYQWKKVQFVPWKRHF